MKAKTDFEELISFVQYSKGQCYVLCDENTFKHCYEVFCRLIAFPVQPIVIKAGEAQKNIATCEFIWQKLIDNKADKNACIINLGGGVVSDIGGFVAATYKRGIKYINVPTSLLAMVDAATGGKTGINLGHFKNMIGLIQQPEMVVLHAPFLNTLPKKHLKNGFAEMLKHAILNGKDALNELTLNKDITPQLNEKVILKSLAIKEDIVAQDPQEKGHRKILNFGHTIGHAIEYAAQENGCEILHGEAVAIGMIAALKLSVLKLEFDCNEADLVINFIRSHFSTPAWISANHNKIINAILQDKKNSNQEINMVLLADYGKPVFDVVCTLDEIAKILLEL